MSGSIYIEVVKFASSHRISESTYTGVHLQWRLYVGLDLEAMMNTWTSSMTHELAIVNTLFSPLALYQQPYTFTENIGVSLMASAVPVRTHTWTDLLDSGIYLQVCSSAITTHVSTVAGFNEPLWYLKLNEIILRDCLVREQQAESDTQLLGYVLAQVSLLFVEMLQSGPQVIWARQHRALLSAHTYH